MTESDSQISCKKKEERVRALVENIHECIDGFYVDKSEKESERSSSALKLIGAIVSEFDRNFSNCSDFDSTHTEKIEKLIHLSLVNILREKFNEAEARLREVVVQLHELELQKCFSDEISAELTVARKLYEKKRYIKAKQRLYLVVSMAHEAHEMDCREMADVCEMLGDIDELFGDKEEAKRQYLKALHINCVRSGGHALSKQEKTYRGGTEQYTRLWNKLIRNGVVLQKNTCDVIRPMNAFLLKTSKTYFA